MDGDYLRGEILVGDETAIRSLEAGTQELSIGYSFRVAKNDSGAYISQGPLIVNHIALVKRGRAGSKVRVLDKKDFDMNEQEIKAAIDTAIRTALKPHTSPGLDASSIATAISAAVKPVIDEVREVKDQQIRIKDEAEKEKAKAAAKTAADELIDRTRKEERRKAEVIVAAQPHLSEKQLDTDLFDMDEKEILLMAVGDKVRGGKRRSTEYLRGVLDMMEEEDGDFRYSGYHGDDADDDDDDDDYRAPRVPSYARKRTKDSRTRGRTRRGGGRKSKVEDARQEYIKQQSSAWEDPPSE